MEDNLTDFVNENQMLVHNEIKKHLENLSIPNRLKESMLYSFDAGGKRLRPILLIASYESFHNNGIAKVHSTAVALEMIHTYSLIHDDLPAMDDDDIRRGQPTNHKAFDEATAILAGDALLTYSFELIAKDEKLSPNEKVKILKMLSQASGPKGMVAGQVMDMAAEGRLVTLEQLEKIHTLKTGKLISFAVLTGAYLAGASEEQLAHLGDFANYLGLIFQVQDDILDVVGDPDVIGKPVGSDVDSEKSTYPSLLGLDGAEKKKKIYEQKAIKALENASIEQSYLKEFIYYLSDRDH